MAALRKSRRTFIAAAGTTAAAYSLMRAPARSAQFEFKCGSNLGSTHPSSIRLSQMWQTIEQESGGRLSVKFFPDSALGGDAAMLEQVRVGALEFDYSSPGVFAPLVPSANLFYLGFAFRDSTDGLRALDGPPGAYVRREAATKGLHVLRAPWDSGVVQIGSNTHPINKPDDLRGFKIRVPPTKIVVDLFKVLGASPTPTSANEIYTGLQTKLLDGEVAPLTSIQAFRFFEVNKYISMTNHAWAGQQLIASPAVWNKLPDDLRTIVERNNGRFASYVRQDIAAGNAALTALLTKEGQTFNAVDQAPFRAPLRPYFQEWAREFGPTLWGQFETSLGRKLV